jgi:exonuclease III
MKSFLYLFGFLSFAFSSDTECPIVTTQQDRRADKSRLRLMQYNVEWLYIDHYSSFDCPGTDCPWANESEAEKHMQYVSDVIKDINPDVVNFCEVEGCDELNMLIDELDPTYLPYLKKGTDTSTGQNVGMITRIDPTVSLYRTEQRYSYPIQGSKCGYTGTGSTGVSKHYITEFKIDYLHFAFISAHLIAIPTDSSRCAQREGQAMILQQVIHNFTKDGYDIIMIGDFNDYDGIVLDVNSNIPTSQVLEILKGNSGELANTYQLSSVATNMQQSERFSDWWDSDNNCATASSKDYSMIDHILVTENIKKYITNTFIYHGYPEYCGKYDSDHYPVIIDLEI